MCPRQGQGSLSVRGWQQGDIHCSDHVEKTNMLTGKDGWMGLVWLWLSEWWWLFWYQKCQQKRAGTSYLLQGSLLYFGNAHSQTSSLTTGTDCLMPSASWRVPEEMQTRSWKIPRMFWRPLCRNLHSRKTTFVEQKLVLYRETHLFT